MRRIGPGLMPRHLQQYVCVHRSPSQNPFSFYHDLFRPANCSGVGAACFPQDSSRGTQSTVGARSGDGYSDSWREIPIAPVKAQDAFWEMCPRKGRPEVEAGSIKQMSRLSHDCARQTRLAPESVAWWLPGAVIL